MAASTVNTSRELGGVFGVAVLGAVVNSQITGGLTQRLIELHIPVQFRSIVIQFVTTGGSPSTIHVSNYPKSERGTIAEVLAAAEQYAGHGVHLALQIAAGIVLAAGLVALVAARRTRET
jgi:hypothetical protein